MENFNVLVGNMIKELRKSKNISQKDIAILLKKDQSAISYWESGRRQMNIGDLIIYLDAIKATDEEKSELFQSMSKIKRSNYSFDYKENR